MMRVELVRIDNERVTANTDGVIVGRRGELRLEGEDWGPLVEQFFGRDDHEYAVTVGSAHRNTVQVMLVVERFGADAGEMLSWLRDRGYSVDGEGEGPLANVQVLGDGTLRVTASEGTFTVGAGDFDRLTLDVLKDLFDAERFRSDAEFKKWLDEHGVPASTWTY
jgi:hypothetical protein